MKCTGINLEGEPCEVDLEIGFAFCDACGAVVPKELTVPPQAIPAISEPEFKGCYNCGAMKSNDSGYCIECGALSRPVLRSNFCIELSPNLALHCHQGRKHTKRNDDYGIVARRKVNGEWVTWSIVCDGVSKSRNAHMASEAAVKAASVMIELMIIGGNFDPENVISQAIIAAQKAVLAVPSEDLSSPDSAKLPAALTTITVVLLADDKAHYGWVGDSRIYAIYSQDGACGAARLTRDDSILNVLIDEGMTREEALLDSMSKGISQCLGTLGGITPHVKNVSLKDVAAIVLCTDGAYFAFDAEDDKSPEKLAAIYATSGGAAMDFSSQLVDFANDSGGPDNITVAVLFCNSNH